MRVPMGPRGLRETAESRVHAGTLDPQVDVGTWGRWDTRDLQEKRVPPRQTIGSEKHAWEEKAHIDRICIIY